MCFDKSQLESELLHELAKTPYGHLSIYLTKLYVTCIGPRLAFRGCVHMLAPLDAWIKDEFDFEIRAIPSVFERFDRARRLFRYGQEDEEEDPHRFRASYFASWESLGEAAYEWGHPLRLFQSHVFSAFLHMKWAHRGWLQVTEGLSVEDAQVRAVAELARFVADNPDVPYESKRFRPFEELGLSEETLGRRLQRAPGVEARA